MSEYKKVNDHDISLSTCSTDLFSKNLVNCGMNFDEFL